MLTGMKKFEDYCDVKSYNLIKIRSLHLLPVLYRLFTSREKVSERWLFNSTRAIFQLYHGKNKFLFAKVMNMSVLY